MNNWSKPDGQNIIVHNYAFDGECLRALGINILDSWNFSANLLGYFRSPRGLQGAALELLGKKISKDREEGKGCGWR
jgi:hypothetical protein